MATFGRNDVSLNTTATGDNFQFYDQVCALSQNTINTNFKKLFEQRPEVRELEYVDVYNNRRVLKGTMAAPTVILNPANSDSPELEFQVRFATGAISWSKNNSLSLAGWVITVVAQINDFTVSPVANRDQETEDLAKLQLTELKKTFQMPGEGNPASTSTASTGSTAKTPTKMVPGEYSIHRMFAAISESKWSSPVLKRSWVPVGDPSAGKFITLDEWQKDGQNKYRASDVLATLRSWALDNQESAFFTLGLQLRLPTPNDNPLKPTFVPYLVRMQNYPYISEDDQKNLVKDNKTLVGQMDCLYNCLMFCEITQNRDGTLQTHGTRPRELPTVPRLPFSGNLALPPAGADPEVTGSFVLDHRMFFEKYILKELQELCVACNVIPLYPEMGYDAQKWDVFRARISVGANPADPKWYPGLPNQVASDDSFKFKPQGKGRYSWSSSLVAPGSDTELMRYTESVRWPFYRKWSIKAKNSVDVTWTPGGDTFTITGKSVYDHWEGYQTRENFGWGPGNGALYGKIDVTANWTFAIDLHVPKKPEDEPLPNGVIEPTILFCDEVTKLPTSFVVKCNDSYVLDDTAKRISNQIQENIKTSIKKINTNLKTTFSGTGSFVYPGCGELKFGPPTIGSYGDILATIDYLPLKDGRVSVVAPTKPGEIKEPEKRPPQDIKSDPMETEKLPKLTYGTSLKSYDPVAKKGTIVLTGLNTTGAVIAFTEVDIMPLAIKSLDGKALYNSMDFVAKPAKQPVQAAAAPSVAAAPKLQNGPSGTGVSANGPSAQSNGPASAPSGAATSAPVAAQTSTNGVNGTEPTAKTGNVDTAPQQTTAMPDSSSGDWGWGDPPKEPVKEPVKEPGTEPVKEPVKEPAKPEPTPPEPAPTETWNVTQDGDIKQQIDVTAVDDGSGIPNFLTIPKILPKPNKTPDRFIMGLGSSFSVELEGTIEQPGDYVLQIREIWNSPDTSVKISGFADAYFQVRLNEDGGGYIFPINFKTAEKLRGA